MKAYKNNWTSALCSTHERFEQNQDHLASFKVSAVEKLGSNDNAVFHLKANENPTNGHHI